MIIIIMLSDIRNNYCQISLIIYQLFLISQFLLSRVDSCPDNCSPCLNDDIFCDKQGLLEFPKLGSIDPKKMTIQNQQFSNPVLDSTNFSTYSRLEELSIRSSHINRIRSYTLSNLSKLRNVDFSDNTNLYIESHAFYNLNLALLKLDSIGVINLDLHAFAGLKVDTLSIQNSNLLTLPYELIQPIGNSITKLLLKNNQLRSLDSRLKPVLLKLKNLELQENPFICNCSLLWLSEILESKKTEVRVFDTSEDSYPRCVSPPELRKEYVYTLVTKLKNCAPPTIVRIDVVFHSIASVGLYCYIKDIENSNDQTEIGWFHSGNQTNSLGAWKNSIQVPLNSFPSKYKCKAQNDLGNSEIDLLLSWNEQEKSTLIVENNTFKFEETTTKQNFLWEKVFSLFEMICAIFGTLVITVILFFLFCCCYVERNSFLLINNKKRKLQTKTYPPYEPGIYSDTKMYCETNMEVCHFPPPPPPTPPPLPDTRLIPQKLF